MTDTKLTQADLWRVYEAARALRKTVDVHMPTSTVQYSTGMIVSPRFEARMTELIALLDALDAPSNGAVKPGDWRKFLEDE